MVEELPALDNSSILFFYKLGMPIQALLMISRQFIILRIKSMH